jgi:probable phosphoglycerate mutase
MITFYIVRHGESEGNIQNVVQGHIETHLTTKGKEQAKALALKLKNKSFDAIYSSSSLRAKETAEIIASIINVSVNTSDLLKERTQGKFEGMKTDDFLNLYTEWDTLSHEEKLAHKFHETQESFYDAMDRFVPFLKEVAKKHQDQTVLIVTHGGIIRGFLITQRYGDFDSIGGIENCGYIQVNYDNKDFRIKKTYGLKTWNKTVNKN